MKTVGACSRDDYITSFWERERLKSKPECRKNPSCAIPQTLGEKEQKMLKCCPYKLPDKPDTEFIWQVRRIGSQKELGDLWTHKDGDWLERHGLWEDSGEFGVSLGGKRLPRQRLAVYARKAIEGDFFGRESNRDTAQFRNYHNWKGKSLAGVLSKDERPMLVERKEYIDVLDGFGRLLPYLALILQGSPFVAFDAYYAIEQPPS